MTKIKNAIIRIDQELNDAKEYAEISLENKAMGISDRAKEYRDMANDELRHAMVLHDYAVQDIEALNEVFKPTTLMLETWEKAHAEYVERTAWVKMMLTM